MKALNEYLSSAVKHTSVDIKGMSLAEFTKYLKDNNFDEIPRGKMSIYGNAYTMFTYKRKAFLIWYDERNEKSFFSDSKDKTYTLLVSDGKDILCQLYYDPNKELKNISYYSGFYGTNWKYKSIQYCGDQATKEMQKFLFQNENTL